MSPWKFSQSLSPSDPHTEVNLVLFNRSTAQTFKLILHESGVRGFWRGTGPTVVRLSVGAGINFVVLERLKHFMLQSVPHVSGQLGFLQAALVGGAKAKQEDQT